MPLKIGKRIKHKPLQTRHNFEKFDKALASCVAIWILALVVLTFIPSQRSEYSLGNAWSFSVIPEAQIIGGTYGPEMVDREWLTGNPLIIRVSNPLKVREKLRVQVQFGASPCGTFPHVAPEATLVKSISAEILTVETLLDMHSNSSKDFILNFIPSVCSIQTDSRNFIGAVFYPVVLRS